MTAAPDLLFGWKEIAEALNVLPNRAWRWHRRNRDPLPVYWGHRGIFASRRRLALWYQRWCGDPGEALVGWRIIALALRVDVRTAQDWAARDEDPLPVDRTGKPTASREALHDWAQRHVVSATLARALARGKRGRRLRRAMDRQ